MWGQSVKPPPPCTLALCVFCTRLQSQKIYKMRKIQKLIVIWKAIKQIIDLTIKLKIGETITLLHMTNLSEKNAKKKKSYVKCPNRSPSTHLHIPIKYGDQRLSGCSLSESSSSPFFSSLPHHHLLVEGHMVMEEVMVFSSGWIEEIYWAFYQAWVSPIPVTYHKLVNCFDIEKEKKVSPNAHDIYYSVWNKNPQNTVVCLYQ